MKNIKLVLFLGAFALCGFLYAADSVGGGSGIVRYMNACRWQVTRSSTAASLVTGITNVVATSSSVLGKVYVTAPSNCTFTVYNSPSVALCVASNIAYDTYTVPVASHNIPTLVVDFDEGIGCPNGIAVVTVRDTGSTNAAVANYIHWDKAR